MAYLTFDITLEQPAMFTALEGEPNSAVSYDFIPGSAIRGMFIGVWINKYTDGDLNLSAPPENTMRYFFENRTRYLNAYPLINGEHLTCPVPMTWQKDKYSNSDSFRVKDGLFGQGVVGDIAFTKPKRVDGFTAVNKYPIITAPQRLLNVHTTRARGSALEQQVFRYDALGSGQYFRAIVLCESEQDANVLKGLLPDRMSIGGVQNAGYGLMATGNVRVDNHAYMHRSETDNTLIITLLSDVILRDANGEYCPTPETLCYTLKEDYGLHAEVEIAITDTTVVGGFNRKWGLPLPQTPALKRGSVVKLMFADTPDVAILNDILREGIGERRNDGFGQIAINWQASPEFSVSKVKKTAEQGNPDAELDSHSERMWRRLRRQIGQKRNEDKIAYTVYENTNLIIGNATNTQLSRLRREVRQALNQSKVSFESLDKYLKSVQNKVAGKALEHARVGDINLRQWLLNIMNEGMKPKTALRYIDVVLHRSIKLETEKKRREANTQGISND